MNKKQYSNNSNPPAGRAGKSQFYNTQTFKLFEIYIFFDLEFICILEFDIWNFSILQMKYYQFYRSHFKHKNYQINTINANRKV